MVRDKAEVFQSSWENRKGATSQRILDDAFIEILHHTLLRHLYENGLKCGRLAKSIGDCYGPACKRIRINWLKIILASFQFVVRHR